MSNRYYKDEIFGYLAGDLRSHVVFYNNIKKYYNHIDYQREMIRSYITWIEATINYMTEYLLKVSKEKPTLFTTKDIQQLESNWNDEFVKKSSKRMTFFDKIKFTFHLFVGNNSEMNKKRPKRMDFKSKFKFTFKLFAIYHCILPQYTEYIERHFDNLLKVVAMRNKFTHPRQESDLIISKLDFDLAFQSYKDYYDFQDKYFEGIFYEDRDE